MARIPRTGAPQPLVLAVLAVHVLLDVLLAAQQTLDKAEGVA
jgi:hypothetical protein